MKSVLSVIIPSYKRQDFLLNIIANLVQQFDIADFDDYEIIAVNSGAENYIPPILNEKVKIYNFHERMYPGIARNMGMKYCSSEWVWFIDDDDETDLDKMKALLLHINNCTDTDVVAHSLKLKYGKENINKDLAKNVCCFREKQEVFNYVFRKSLVETKNLKFSDGVHEDIRFVTELLLLSNKVDVLDLEIYKKITRDDSITKKLSRFRLDGFINYIQEVLSINNSTIQEIKEEIVYQSLGTVLYLINKCDYDEKLNFLDYIRYKIPSNITDIIKNKYTKKNSNFKYAVSLFLSNQNTEKLIEDLDYCFRTHLSCRDLKNSVFFGPHEIIGCCKRFFYKGKMKGDIILMPDSSDITLQKILDKKKEVELAINREEYEACEGCPYIERFEKKVEEKINYISLENYTYCNMKCSYCSPKYYSGREALYDTYGIISELIKGNHLDKLHVVWGGGEPTLSPKFYEITSDLLNNKDVSIVRVLSNSLRFSEGLNELINHGKIRLVTSIDAGTQEKFKEIRGRGEMNKVLDNLSTYKKSMDSSENLTIKYIMTEDNCDSVQLDGFVQAIKSYGFLDNFIQISCNFKLETPNESMTYAIYELAARLLNGGFKFVYFDDLIRDRLHLSREFADKMLEFLRDKNLSHSNIFSHNTDKRVILWGSGYQSEWIKNETNFGKAGKILKIVSGEKELDGMPEDVLVCPSAVQSLPDIYKQIKKSLYLNKMGFVIFI